MSTPELSVVIPLCNESAVVDELASRLTPVISGLGVESEIILIDDGSTDDTLPRIKETAARHHNVRYLSFSRNFGHQPAVSAGIDHARGRAVIVMDGDLQDPPEMFPALVAKWKEGWDVVYAIRRKRKEGWMLRSCFYLFYRLLQKMADVRLPLDAGDFCLMDRKVVDVLKSMPERNRYVRGIRAWAGFRQTGVEYEREGRWKGEPKYSVFKLVRLALDGVTGFSRFPIRFCGYVGFAMACLSFLGLGYGLVSKFFWGAPLGWTSTIMAVFFIGGVQLIMLALVGAYVGRIYTEVQQRPIYVVREKGNFEEGTKAS